MSALYKRLLSIKPFFEFSPFCKLSSASATPQLPSASSEKTFYKKKKRKKVCKERNNKKKETYYSFDHYHTLSLYVF